MVWQSCKVEVKRLRSDLTGDFRANFEAKLAFARAANQVNLSGNWGWDMQPKTFCNQNFLAGNLTYRGAHLFDGRHQACRQSLLRRGRKLFALAGQVEDVNRRFAFCINQRDLDVALEGR